MLLRRTARKSLTVTLWLMSITASSPSTDGFQVDDSAGPEGAKDAVCAGDGAGRLPHPAKAGAVSAAKPLSAPRREIIVPTSDCSPRDECSTRASDHHSLSARARLALARK